MDEITNQIYQLAGMGVDGAGEEQNLENEQYTKDDEYRSRERAREAVRKESLGYAAENSSAGVQKFIKMLDQSTKENATLKDEINKMRQEFEGLKSGYSMVKSDVDYHTERQIIDDVSRYEDELANDEVLGQYYNKAEIRNIMKEEAQKGKVLTPYEALSIKAFKDIAAENYRMKQQIETKRRFLDNPISGIAASKVKDMGDLANVHDSASATEYAKRMMKQKYGF